MTDLLARRPVRTTSHDGPPRPLARGAAVAGLVASSSVLMLAIGLALAAWFGSGASHGTRADAARVGADAWLLAQGAHLQLVSATVSLLPLGVTLLSGYVTFRLGRWAGRAALVEDMRTAVTGAVVLAAVYAGVTLATAVLASLPEAQPHLGWTVLGGAVLALLFGGWGILSGSGLGAAAWRSRVPESLRAAVTLAWAVVLLLVAVSSLLLAAALLVHLGPAATVLSRLHLDIPSALAYTLVVAVVVPNAVLLSATYLLGPGFAVGAGTLVSPSVVVLGPVPAFPLLAALPAEGPGPAWARALVGVPALLALVAGGLVARAFPGASYRTAALRSLGGGVLGALLVTVLVLLAGGSVGPGRMADVGASAAQVLVAALAPTSLGALLGGLLGTWWTRRRAGRQSAGEDTAAEGTSG